MPNRSADTCTSSRFSELRPWWCAPCTRSRSSRLPRCPSPLRCRRSLSRREFSSSKDRPSPILEIRPERRHQMRIRLMKERSARNQRHGNFHRVHLVEIFFAGFCAAPHSQNSVFAVEINGDFFGQIVRDEIGNSPAEIYIRAIRQFQRRALRDLFPLQSRLNRHDLFMYVVTRHSEVLSLVRCDERRSPVSSHVPDLSYPPARFLPLRRWSSLRPWP